MKINKIVLYNFNSFEGLNEFDFSCEDSNKNIVLIGGKNGAGKTSLFTAIKIALYGPLAFGYMSVNPHYISKIKDCINLKAFQSDIVEAKVQITISLMVEREIMEYEITRAWDYSKQKLIENYYVKMNGLLLDDGELSYFQNYLKGLIPPDLFEFFLFDGEEVGNIFSTSSYNSYIQNAIYTLCGLDIFQIVSKHTRGYVGKALNVDDEKLFEQYEEIRATEEYFIKEKEKLERQVDTVQIELDQIETEIIELETVFKNAGGISEIERQKLAKELEMAERIKAESVARMKLFVEDLMPFYIVKEFTSKIINQLDYEEKGEIYSYIQQRIDREEISAILNGTVSDEIIDSLMNLLLDKFKPVEFTDNVQPVHDLSKEDNGRVNAMISAINNFDSQAMVETVNQRKTASDRTMEINNIFKRAMTDVDAARFAEKANVLLKQKDKLTRQLYGNQAQIDALKKEIEGVAIQRDRALQGLKDNAQNKHVFELSAGLTRMMDTLLADKTVTIKKRLEDLIISNLQHIYRKNNLITHIEIDECFQFSLYQNAEYSVAELTHLMKNLGKEEFLAAIGRHGQKRIFKKYNVCDLKQLQQVLSSIDAEESIELFKKIDLSRLSKGERQIFILSLYWAIIEVSGQDIPFVIDTPYARIDANHRREISEKFFPNISKQVIILSTDEEINEEYYRLIKPHIAKEFLLINDEGQNKTSVEQHYFYEA